MPLTPEDVRNKLFTTTKRMRQGYDEDEVDGFLDEVEAEIARLLKENADLKAKVASLASSAPAAPVVPATSVTPAAPAVPAPTPAAAMSADEASGSALRVLAAAQKTADETVAEAKRSAEKLVGDARARREAAEKELADHHKSVMGTLESDRDKLERQVENLRTFEREYRARLKVYLEGQLRDLEGRGGSAARPADGPPTAAPAAGVTTSTTPPPTRPGTTPPGTGAPASSFGHGSPATPDDGTPSGPPREAPGGAFVVDEGPEAPPAPTPPHG